MIAALSLLTLVLIAAGIGWVFGVLCYAIDETEKKSNKTNNDENDKPFSE